jgi:hypothetical protein
MIGLQDLHLERLRENDLIKININRKNDKIFYMFIIILINK